MIRTLLLLAVFAVTFVVLSGIVGRFGNVGPVELLVLLLLAAGVAVLVGRVWRRRPA